MNNDEIISRIDSLQEQIAKWTQEQNTQYNVSLKPLGKYHDIYLLLIGFVFTAIVGGFISFNYQRKMYDYQKKAINYENRQHEITDFYKSVSTIITSRYLAAFRLLSAYKAHRPSRELEIKKEAYYSTVDEWSKHDAYNRAFIKNNFSDSTFKAYEAVSYIFTQKLHKTIYSIVSENADSTFVIKGLDLINEQSDKNRIFFMLTSNEVFSVKND